MRRLRLPTTSGNLHQAQTKNRPEAQSGVRLNSTAVACGSGQQSGRAAMPAVRIRPQTWRDPVKHWTTIAAAGFIAAAAIVPATAADISGAGATFPYPIYAKWA